MKRIIILVLTILSLSAQAWAAPFSLSAGLQGYQTRANTSQVHISKFAILAQRASTSIRLVYGNYYKTGSNPQESGVGNTLNVRAAIEYAGVSYPIYFGGARDKSLSDGANTTSDPLSITVPADATFYIKTYCDASAGYYPTGYQQFAGGAVGLDRYVITYTVDSAGKTSAMADLDKIESVEPWASSSGWPPKSLYAPIAVLGDSGSNIKYASVGVIGDSTVVTNDLAYYRKTLDSRGFGYNDLDGAGWPSRLLRSMRIGTVSVSFGSERALDFAGTNISRRLPLLSNLDYWLVIYGRNDLDGVTVLADLQARLLAIANLAIANGSKPIATTIPPKSASSDLWGTVTNQTADSTNAVRVQVNNWLRTVPAPFVACWDIADAIESARDSGKWAVGPNLYRGIVSTADATHINISAADWAVSDFAVDCLVSIVAGTGSGQIRLISSNSTTQLVTTTSFATIPDATSQFVIYPRFTLDGVHPSYAAHYAAFKALRIPAVRDIIQSKLGATGSGGKGTNAKRF